MERPMQDGGERRTMVVRVRLTPTEKGLLETRALSAGLSLSDLVRSKAIDAKPLLRKPTPERETQLRFLASLGKLGSNINQIAKHLNRKQGSPEFAVPLEIINGAMEGVRTLTAHLRDAFDGRHQGQD